MAAGSLTAFSLWTPTLLSKFGFSQTNITSVFVAAEIGTYLPVTIIGLLCDRWSRRGVSVLGGALLGAGYIVACISLTAASASNQSSDDEHFVVHLIDSSHEERKTRWLLMTAAFAVIGCGTSCLYLSSLTTCVLNFGGGRHKWGSAALASPIAAFGLGGACTSVMVDIAFMDQDSGMVELTLVWTSLAIILGIVGLLGGWALRVVEEGLEVPHDAVIYDCPDDAPNYLPTVDEESCLLPQTQVPISIIDESEKSSSLSTFLFDHTAWLFILGFMCTSGPGECYINSLGTLIYSILNPHQDMHLLVTSAASPGTQVRILSITSTLTRLASGVLVDLMCPPISSQPCVTIPCTQPPIYSRYHFKVSRVSLLLLLSAFCALGYLALASGLVQSNPSTIGIVTGIVGIGYGSLFTLAPIVASSVWGMHDFGRNWGIIEIAPAVGAGVWGLVYSWVYEHAKDNDGSGLCEGLECYKATAWGWALSVVGACLVWLWAWRGKGGWAARGIVV